MVTHDPDFESNERLRFEIRLLIRHPSIDPDRITKTLQLSPDLAHMVGAARKGPKGHPLPGLHRDSVWSHWFVVERNRFFFRDVKKLIDRLEPHKAFLIDLEKGGGSVCLILHLPGDINIGDELGWREMERLSAMRIDLGVEVFPEFN